MSLFLLQVFTHERETLLAEYLKKASDIYYGLSPKEVRKFAFQYGSCMNTLMSPTWAEKRMAGAEKTGFI